MQVNFFLQIKQNQIKPSQPNLAAYSSTFSGDKGKQRHTHIYLYIHAHGQHTHIYRAPTCCTKSSRVQTRSTYDVKTPSTALKYDLLLDALHLKINAYVQSRLLNMKVNAELAVVFYAQATKNEPTN